VGAQEAGGGIRETFVRYHVVAFVTVRVAGGTLLLDVADFAIRRALAILAGRAAARESPKPEEPHNAHYRFFLRVPGSSNLCTAELPVEIAVRIAVNGKIACRFTDNRKRNPSVE
jgi:hypothetical protein